MSRAFPVACVIALATLVGAYSNSFDNEFHFDDSHVIQTNLYIRNLGNVPLFFRDATTFSSLPANAGYRPLVSTTLALDYWMGGGLNTRAFHTSQLVMLAALGVMLFFVVLCVLNAAHAPPWGRWAALATATLFCMHTTNTETINLIHVRSELLSLMGIAGSFLLYIYRPGSRRWHLYLIPMVIGAFAKTPAVMFAPLLLVYRVLFEERLSLPDLFARRSWPRVRGAVLRSLPAFIVGAVTFFGVTSMDAPTVDLGGGNRWHYLQTQAFAWLHYGRLFLLPAGLSADTDWRLITQWYDTRVIAGCAFVALLVRLAWVSSKTPALRPAAFGILWFCITLLPASSIIPLAEVSNDHRAFFAFAGLALAAVAGAAHLAAWSAERWPAFAPAAPRFLAALLCIVIGGNAIGTYQRNKVFRSGETLWRDVTEKSPTNGRGLMNYGLTQMAQARYDEAKDLFDRAAALNPNYATLEINLAIVTDRLGQPDVAERHFKRALELNESNPASHSFYAGWLLERGRVDEAIAHLERAVELAPGNLDARYKLMTAYAMRTRVAELRTLVMETLRIAPGDEQAGRYLDERGDIVLPAPPQVGALTAADWINTSLNRYNAGDFQGSIAAAREALGVDLGSAEAYNNIAAAYASLKQWDAAIEAANQALRLKPDYTLARNNLLWAQREKQKADSAGRVRDQGVH